MKAHMILIYHLLLIDQGLSWKDSVHIYGMIIFHEGFPVICKTKQEAQNSKWNFTAEWREPL